MQTHLTDMDIKRLVDRLKQDLQFFKEGTGTLELAFEAATKHMPVYLKIVKGHIDQLAKVLELETHNHRHIDTVGLAEPVTQLMQLFRELDEEDIQLIEALALETRHWPNEQTTGSVQEVTVTEA